ncbi:hypothetical protein QUA74_27450 [Microcoleus sp. LAD1_D3]|uniref:hypothetical protein n=1 Tax=Microcoleus sp. LAD1_D3 TaxID=2819365 RepID=UPI002FD24F2A
MDGSKRSEADGRDESETQSSTGEGKEPGFISPACLIAPDCLTQMPTILLGKFWRGRSPYCSNRLTAKESYESFSEVL